MVVGFGLAASFAIQGIEQNDTPWAGGFERINAYAYFAWLVVLAVTVMRREGPSTRSLGERGVAGVSLQTPLMGPGRWGQRLWSARTLRTVHASSGRLKDMSPHPGSASAPPRDTFTLAFYALWIYSGQPV